MSNAEATTPRPSLSERFDDEIDLRQLWGHLVSGRWVIAGLTAAALALGVLYTVVATPIYEVNTLLQVEDAKGGGLGAIAKDLDGLFDAKSDAAAEIELMKSRLVLGQTIDDLRLAISAKPKTFPVIGKLWLDDNAGITVTRFDVPEAAYAQAFELELLAANRFALSGPEGEALGEGEVNQAFSATLNGEPVGLFVQQLSGAVGQVFRLSKASPADSISDLLKVLSISEKGKQSGIISMSFKHPDRRLAVKIINSVANNYVTQNVERKSAEAGSTLEYIDGQLPELKKALEASEVRFNEYRKRTGSLDISTEGELLLRQTVESEGERLALQQKRQELITRFTPNHPAVQALDAQLARLERESDRFGGEISNMPATQQELLRLTRDLQVNQELYTTLLNNAQQLKVVRGGTVGNVRVVDYALLPIKPVAPKKPLIVVLALLLGAMAGVGVVLVRQALRTGVKKAEDIERALGLSVLAAIPLSNTQVSLSKQAKRKKKALPILTVHETEDLSIESLRSLRTSLHFALLGAKNNVVMMTGPAPAVGKSFVSVNFAAVLAATGKKVLLIDADMRRGYLNQYFGVPRQGGLSELVANVLELSAVVQQSTIAGLDFLTTGELPPNPAELLMHERFSAFLQQASERYDHVLIDTPPVLAVTDAAIVGRLCGASLMIARFDVTPVRELEHAVERLTQGGVSVNGVLLNAVTIGDAGGYQYAYAYKYASLKNST